MTVTDADFQDLTRRVGRLEKASIENTGTIRGWREHSVPCLDQSMHDLTEALPGIIMEAMREVLETQR